MIREFKRDRGFFTFAQNGTHDYLRMAYALALSLKATQKENGFLAVGVTPGTIVPEEYREVFDVVIEIPWGDGAAGSSWKLENEWKAFHMTPYKETIKLDCDMLFTQDISYWWDILSRKDFWSATTAMTYRNEVITSTACRESFVSCNLPNVYSAFTYFKQCDVAMEVFDMMDLITHNWDKFSWEFMGENRPKEGFSTDVALALAIKLTGNVDNCTEPSMEFPTFVHMKTELQNWNHNFIPSEWCSVIPNFLTSDLQLKIANYRQNLPVHYHAKTFLTNDMIETMRKAL